MLATHQVKTFRPMEIYRVGWFGACEHAPYDLIGPPGPGGLAWELIVGEHEPVSFEHE